MQLLKHLEKEGVTGVKFDGESAIYVVAKTKIEIPIFDEFYPEKEERVNFLICSMAKRLAFGFNPKITDIPSSVYK